ncbi:MAG: hypothetical protein AAFX87_15220 [Bacteroidota bacterium]
MQRSYFKFIVYCFCLMIMAPVQSGCYQDDNSTYIGSTAQIEGDEYTNQAEAREDITFILGEDREADNPYYQEASNYYLFNPKGRTEHLVNSCRTLLDVGNYLRSHKPANGLPWGTVHLVSHGNQWNGLSTKVTPHSKRSTADEIEKFLTAKAIEPVSDDILDEASEIFIHGCGVGNNEELVERIKQALAVNCSVKARASKLYEYYTSEQYAHQVKSTHRYLAHAWSISYKYGAQPEQDCIINELASKYPQAQLNWSEVLEREAPRFAGDSYHYTFEVPVKWVIPFPSKSAMPDVSDQEKQLAWIKTQPEILAKLQTLNLPLEKFSWKFRKVYTKDEEGTRTPALWVKGYCTILSVIQPLVEEGDNNKPLLPDLNDDQFYYSTSI